MTETPVLTKKQQKSTLSARKNKTKVTLRNVLVTPYAKYWPLSNVNDTEVLHEVISKHLPSMIVKRAKINWSEFKNVPKSERKAFRKLYLQTHLESSNEENIKKREGVLFGVNDITKAVEQRLVKSVLITDDVQPKLMVEHLIDQSVLFRIPTLVVPNLRAILGKTCGFSSIAIGFTGALKYEAVQQTIERLSIKYPVPRQHINFERSVEPVEVIAVDDSRETSIEQISESNRNVVIDLSGGNSSYLYRKGRGERAFVPERSSASKSNIKMDLMGFLPFSYNQTRQNAAKYIPLKVKKIRGDPNRVKRKIAEMRKAKRKM